tara:strand:- start:612 stop:1502 length:891 start_codon:yes stop_codon:yes gene_type:complete
MREIMSDDFDFAGFLDEDNQRNFVISLIKLFDLLLEDNNEKQIQEAIIKIKENTISKDFAGLISALNSFDPIKDVSRIPILAIINLIAPNIAAADELEEEFSISQKNSSLKITKKLDLISSKDDLRFIAQICEWNFKNNKIALIFQKIADILKDDSEVSSIKNEIILNFPNNLDQLLSNIDKGRQSGFISNEIINLLTDRGLSQRIASLVTKEKTNKISISDLRKKPLVIISLDEQKEPELALEMMELIPKYGSLLTSTSGEKVSTYLFLVLLNSDFELNEIKNIGIKFEEFRSLL